METLMTLPAGPLERLKEEEIRHLLRGFPNAAISGALALRSDFSKSNIESCLVGILTFYLPPGTDSPSSAPDGDTRLRDELGLDSLSLAESMFKLEELFDIRVDNAEIAEIETIADATQLLMEKLESPSAFAPDE